jgi:protein TonB
MPRDLFGNVTHAFDGVGARSRYTVPLSLAAHTVVVAAVVVVPLVASDALPSLRERLELSMVTPLVPPEPPRPRMIPARAPAQVAVDPNAAPIDVPEGVRPETGYEGVTCGDSSAVGCHDGGVADVGLLGGIDGLDALTPPPPPPPVEKPPAKVRVGGIVKAPAKVHDMTPVYPSIAQAARVQGLVIIQATIGVDGVVIDASVLRSVPLLDQAALDAVRQWRYTPTRLNDEPVAVVMTVTVNFTLR